MCTINTNPTPPGRDKNKKAMKINKSKAIRELKEKAEAMYGPSWQPELQVDAYIRGVKDLFDYLRDKEKDDKR